MLNSSFILRLKQHAYIYACAQTKILCKELENCKHAKHEIIFLGELMLIRNNLFNILKYHYDAYWFLFLRSFFCIECKTSFHITRVYRMCICYGLVQKKVAN